MAASCRTHRWELAAIDCFAAVRQYEDYEACDAKLEKEQSRALLDETMAALRGKPAP